MRATTLVLCTFIGVYNAAVAQVSIGIGLPGVSIGINLGGYPNLVPVPGYPVYYAPDLDSNFFFYDGLYWVYADDRWYSSAWYNGPWDLVVAESVPLFVLRIPVGYYRRPPVYFRGWRPEAPPRWGDHWGSDWERRRVGWDRWDHRATPAPAPLPNYQSQYSKDRYPRDDQQRTLREQNYPYQPHPHTSHQRQQPPEQSVPAPRDGRNQRTPQNTWQREQRRDESLNRERKNQPERAAALPEPPRPARNEAVEQRRVQANDANRLQREDRRGEQNRTPQPPPASSSKADSHSTEQHDRSSKRDAREERHDRGNDRDSDRDH